MFNTVLSYRFVQRNRNRTLGQESWLFKDIYKFFLRSPKARRKYLVEVHGYADHLYTVDFYAKVRSSNRYQLRTNQFAAGKLSGTVLDIMADIIQTDPQACFGFVAAAMLDESSHESTKRFRLYAKMLELKVNPTRYKLEAVRESNTILVLPTAIACQSVLLQQLIDRYDCIFREAP